MTELILQKVYYWITPKGTFHDPKEAGRVLGISDQMVKYRCNHKKDGFYKVVGEATELTCKHCGVTKECTPENFRCDKKKGKLYPTKICRRCNVARDNKNKQSKPYIYAFLEGDEVVYIGKTYQLKRRLQRHFQGDCKEDWKNPDKLSIKVSEMSSKADMHVMEQYLIGLWKPRMNLKDSSEDKLTYKLPIPKFEEYKYDR